MISSTDYLEKIREQKWEFQVGEVVRLAGFIFKRTEILPYR